MNKNTRVNERIRAKEIRVIDEDGGQIGILPPFEALKIAKEKDLDLVEISPTAQPPVCRIMNYGKYLYQLNKKAHEAKKHQKVIQVKEIKFRPMTDEHDYLFKKNNIVRFLQEGDKAKASVMFRGREMAHKEIGRQLIGRLIEDLAGVAVVEGFPKMEGSNMFVIFSPKK
ncbi:MAG: translation initiation factor IF-3 [Acidobacteria bacterium]|nr:MAG: translation initiation factor IF-3 [Acidobacteriota bacterium]